MTADLTVLTVFAEQTNVNGDAENALVLTARARWAGFSAQRVDWRLGDPVPKGRPDVVVVGSATDPVLPALLDALRPAATTLRRWRDAGTRILAIGTGWELLGQTIHLDGQTLEGLALLPGRAVAGSGRVTDDLVVDSPFGRLVGFENHLRDVVLPAGSVPLGRVVYGRGNGSDDRAEGLVDDTVIATHLHGPVLAKNPALADDLLSQVLGAGYTARTAPAELVDETARAARSVIATRLGLSATDVA
ncbi:type 1 glutamine amidotransferase [Galbitalea soli]|uniref:Lipid II isoglutaminyl synthase (glutamine-hydrolyzing) subunit GatD n=1 Tax=Galbitalea soli TaxID=1268042 RepID=A0A7C9PLH7_9MICO|nr:cobyric acid synthase [Galbitalea soli]NEM90273.1 cobyric acid synthase [Galbitalea soli]NYJ30981.1 hypothetical protein [Galbitalea soli]